jgi:hypothetical protein
MRRSVGLYPGFDPCRAIPARLKHQCFSLFFLALVAGLTQCSPPQREIPFTKLSSGFQPLRAQFNQDVGKVRLLLLLDPT